MRFSNDVDLLKWEPMLFRDLYYRSQTTASGSDGVMNGTLTAAGGLFQTRGVHAGQVIYLQDDQELDGGYEIDTVDSDTQLIVSVVRASANDPPVSPPTGTAVRYRISTFEPQIEEAAVGLMRKFGLRAEMFGGAREVLTLPALRQASTFRVLMRVLSVYAGSCLDGGGLWDKVAFYLKQFEQLCDTVCVELDTELDGGIDIRRSGRSFSLKRR